MATNKQTYTNATRKAVNTNKHLVNCKTTPFDYPGFILDVTFKPVGKTHTSKFVCRVKKNKKSN